MQNKLVNESFMIKTNNIRQSDLSVERQVNQRLQDKYDKEHQR